MRPAGSTSVSRTTHERRLGDVLLVPLVLPCSARVSTRFAAQWLRLQDLEKIHPDVLLFPQYDDTLAQSMAKETERFFDSIVREDRSVLDLLTADYSFVNERLAKHYGMPNVTGSAFRRVPLPEYRRGLLGQGSIRTRTAVADRPAPGPRGRWVMVVQSATPPPRPPYSAPALDVAHGVPVVDGGLQEPEQSGDGRAQLV